MKYTIKNPLNSPYNVAGEKGQVHVPARGEVTAEFSEMQIHVVKAVGYFEVTEATGKRDPLDHDGDGVKGGFNTSSEPVNETPGNEHVVEEIGPSISDDTESETAPDVPKRRGRPPKNAD